MKKKINPDRPKKVNRKSMSEILSEIERLQAKRDTSHYLDQLITRRTTLQETG